MSDFDDISLPDIPEPTNEELFSLAIALYYDDFDEITDLVIDDA